MQYVYCCCTLAAGGGGGGCTTTSSSSTSGSTTVFFFLQQQRLQQALERELRRINLEDLLFDLRSSQASLEQDGGLMLP